MKNERTATHQYHDKNKQRLDAEHKVKDLTDYQNMRMKYDFYSKHMQKYMNGATV